MPPNDTETKPQVDPNDRRIFISAKEMGEILNLGRAQTYALLNEGVVESRFLGRRRLVVLDSLRAFAESLPTERPL